MRDELSRPLTAAEYEALVRGLADHLRDHHYQNAMTQAQQALERAGIAPAKVLPVPLSYSQDSTVTVNCPVTMSVGFLLMLMGRVRRPKGKE